MSARIPMVFGVNPIEFDGIRTQADLDQPEWLRKLNRIAIQQIALLLENHAEKRMEIER